MSGSGGGNSISCGGCGGCVGTVAGLIFLWAAVFGVTYHGVHYGLSCSCAHGMAVDTGAP